MHYGSAVHLALQYDILRLYVAYVIGTTKMHNFETEVSILMPLSLL